MLPDILCFDVLAPADSEKGLLNICEGEVRDSVDDRYDVSANELPSMLWDNKEVSMTPVMSFRSATSSFSRTGSSLRWGSGGTGGGDCEERCFLLLPFKEGPKDGWSAEPGNGGTTSVEDRASD